MEKSTSEHKVPFIALAIFLILIIFSSLLSLEKKRKDEIIYQEKIALELAQRKIWEGKEKEYLMGKFDPSINENFILIPEQYTLGGDKMYLRKETFNAFLKMEEAYNKDTVDLKIASATRNFDYQKDFWNSQWSGIKIVKGQNLAESFPDGLERFKKILEYTAVPGTSRHHWGTEIDINDSNLQYYESEKGQKEYEWLTQNAPLFGFCQTYNLKGSSRPEGYNEEKWHWSYLPLAKVFTEEYKNLIKEEDVNGFLGDQYVPGQDLINRYVLSINPDCL